MLRMWGDNVAAPLNVVHLGYGFGAVFANFLVKPFLGEDKKPIILSDNSTKLIEKEISNIKIPYAITGFCCLLICIGHFIFLIYEQRKKRQIKENRSTDYSTVSTKGDNEKKEEKKYSEYSPKSCGNGYFTYGLIMSIIYIIFMFFVSGNDQTFGKFFFSFLTSSQFQISKQGATWGMILYWLSYSVCWIFFQIYLELF